MNDQSTVRLVIGVLGVLALTVVIGGIVLVMDEKSMPDALIAMGSVSVGAVAGILARTSGDSPVPVTLQDEPIETIAAPAKPKKGTGKKS